ncbi:MAG: coiled-coil domain-containing protein [Pirellulaceae bacterium]
MTSEAVTREAVSRDALPGDVLCGMRTNFQKRVRQVARRARALVRLYAVGWFVATVCLAALGLGLVDYLVRFQDTGVRFICFALVCLVAVWGSIRYLLSAWRYRCSDVQAAQRIERRFPALGDMLSSAVAFCAQSANDVTAGSFELRRTVISQAEAAAEPLDFTACLDRRQPLRAVAAAGAVIGVVLVFALLDGPAFALAARRLLVPWQEHPWPRRHVLEFVVAPTRLAAGEDFEVELVDAKGALPDEVQIHYWFDGEDSTAIETQAMQPLGQKLTHRLTNVTRGFFYRATGGDDQHMPWRELRIVEPSRVQLQEIYLEPPGYTGLASRSATGNFRTLRGTRVTLHVRVSKPLSRATLETETSDNERSIPLRLDPDRRGCSLTRDDPHTWMIRQSGSYGFRLIDEEGIDSGAKERWEVEALQDAPPTVSLKYPATDMFLTAQAQLVVESLVIDDLAVRSVALHFTRSDAGEQGEQVIALWNGPEQVIAESENAASRENEGVQRTVRYEWDLAGVPQLEPGSSIAFRVVATDYLPQEGPSATRRITIMSAEDYEDRIAQRQAEILAQIAELVRVQQQTHGQTSQLEIPLREIGTLGRDEVDQLQGAELNQRQVQQRLGHPNDGMGAQVAELMRELESNRLDSSENIERLQNLRDGVDALNENTLPQIEHHLVDALKFAREELASRGSDGTGGDSSVRDRLLQLVQEAAAGQAEVVRSLQQMLGQLSQWDSYRQLAREVGQLRREQESVNQRTQDLRRDTLSKDVQGLTDAQRVALLSLTEQQNDIALRFDTLRGRMDATRQGLADEDPSTAATLVDALELVQRVGIGSAMRDAARGMESNRLSQASEQQDRVIQRLGELQDILANRRDRSGNRDAERLRPVLQAVTELRDRQQRLWTETRQGSSPPPSASESVTADDLKDAWQRVAQEQATLAQDVVSLQQTVTDIRSLVIALEDAAAAATMAARRIQQSDTEAVPQTMGYQQQVIDILTRVLAALQDDPSAPPEPQEPQPDPPAEPPPPQENANVPFRLMQLKLSRALQQELNDRTIRLDQQTRDADGWNADRTRLQLDLTRRQGALAGLLEELQGADAPAEPAAASPPADDHLEQLERALDRDAPPAATGSPGDRKQPAETIDKQLLDGLPDESTSSTQPPTPSAAGQSPVAKSLGQGHVLQSEGQSEQQFEGQAEGQAQKLSPPGSDIQPADPLEQIGHRMREVERRLAQRDLAEPTQGEQRQIVAELETLIESLISQQKQQQSQGQTRRERQGEDPTDQQGQQAASDSTDRTTNADHPADSGPGSVQRVVGDIWGHLPERYRRQIQNAGDVEFLPPYRKLIEDYYRRLSEDRDQ